MSTLSFPAGVTPSFATMEYVAPARMFVSPITGAVQTETRGGDRWEVELEWQNLIDSTSRRELASILMRLVTLENRIYISPYGQAKRGSYGGTPLIAGAGQTGTSIAIDGVTNSVTGWAKDGDHVQIGTQLVRVLADANSNGSGQVTLSVRPAIRTAPADNSAVDVTTPEGIFMLAEPRASWDLRPGQSVISSFRARFIEDVLA